MLRPHWPHYLIGALVVALTLTGAGLWHQLKRTGAQAAHIEALQERLDGAEKRAKAAAKASVARERLRASTAAQAASQAASAEAAIATNREWADQPVPKEVQDALAP